MQIASSNAPGRKSKRDPIGVERAWISDSGEFLLLQEMMHRINNELTSTIGIISCAAERSNNCGVKVAQLSSSKLLMASTGQ